MTLQPWTNSGRRISECFLVQKVREMRKGFGLPLTALFTHITQVESWQIEHERVEVRISHRYDALYVLVARATQQSRWLNLV